MEKVKTVGFRVTAEQWRKLQRLARLTRRTPSDVVRLLIDAASAGTVDVRLEKDWQKPRGKEAFSDDTD